MLLDRQVYHSLLFERSKDIIGQTSILFPSVREAKMLLDRQVYHSLLFERSKDIIGQTSILFPSVREAKDIIGQTSISFPSVWEKQRCYWTDKYIIPFCLREAKMLLDRQVYYFLLFERSKDVIQLLSYRQQYKKTGLTKLVSKCVDCWYYNNLFDKFQRNFKFSYPALPVMCPMQWKNTPPFLLEKIDKTFRFELFGNITKKGVHILNY